MVFWGPWQEGIEVTQTIDMRTSASTWSNGDDSLASEWVSQTAFSWGTTASHTEQYDLPLESPPGYDPAISSAAWGKMLLTKPLIGGGGGGDTTITQSAGQIVPSVGKWNTTEVWTASGVARRLVFGADGFSSAGLSGVPDFAEWPAGATVATLETPEHPNDTLTLTDARILPPTASANPWKFIVKDAGLWPWFDGETTLASLVLRNGFKFVDDPPISLDVDALNDLVALDRALATPEDVLDPLAPAWPSVATLYSLDWPGWFGPIGQSDTFAPDGDLDHIEWPRAQLTYRLPRYRFGYDEPITVPYRRISNRGDGLAGGARRIGQRPKTIQGSNRRGPAAIV